MTQSMLTRSAYICFLLLIGNPAEAQVDRYIDLDRDYKDFQVFDDGNWAFMRIDEEFNRHYAIVDLNMGEIAHRIEDRDEQWSVRALFVFRWNKRLLVELYIYTARRLQLNTSEILRFLVNQCRSTMSIPLRTREGCSHR